MAYSTTTDYTALQNELRKQKAATTDAATQAAIQAQIDEAQQSKEQKIASDINTYGKYASASELDSAAGIMATNQIGTGYETQKANLNKSYDNARINANNDALSRGMARSTYVSDRLANLDTERANALSDIDASKALAIQNAKANILSDYRANAANQLANEKSEFANNIMAYYPDYQAKINEVEGDGDPTDDWKIQALQAARNQKLLDTYGTTDENAIAQATSTATTTNKNLYAPTKTIVPDALVAQVGMNRTNEGRVATIQRLYVEGKLTDAQVEALKDKFNLG